MGSMISLEEARRAIAQAVERLGTAVVPLAEAHGRVLRSERSSDADTGLEGLGVLVA